MLELEPEPDDDELVAVLLEDDDALLDELELALLLDDALLLLVPPPEPPAPESSPHAAMKPAVRSERQTSDRIGFIVSSGRVGPPHTAQRAAVFGGERCVGECPQPDTTDHGKWARIDRGSVRARARSYTLDP